MRDAIRYSLASTWKLVSILDSFRGDIVLCRLKDPLLGFAVPSLPGLPFLISAEKSLTYSQAIRYGKPMTPIGQGCRGTIGGNPSLSVVSL
jgi:hypothetical protein